MDESSSVCLRISITWELIKDTHCCAATVGVGEDLCISEHHADFHHEANWVETAQVKNLICRVSMHILSLLPAPSRKTFGNLSPIIIFSQDFKGIFWQINLNKGRCTAQIFL